MNRSWQPRARDGLSSSLLLLLGIACGSTTSNPSAGAGGHDAGVSYNLPTDSCPDASVTATGDAGPCLSTVPRSFAQDIVPLFDSCAGEICHDFGNGKIASEIGRPSGECCSALKVIDPGHPERSYLLRKLMGKELCGGSQMPLDKPPFSADEVQTVADWICQGADTTH